MEILIVLIATLVGGLTLKKTAKNYNQKKTASILIRSSWILTVFCIVTMAIMSFHTKSMCRQYKAAEITIELARADKHAFSKIGITEAMFKWNCWLEGVNYYNEVFDLWIPDEVEDLKLLK